MCIIIAVNRTARVFEIIINDDIKFFDDVTNLIIVLLLILTCPLVSRAYGTGVACLVVSGTCDSGTPCLVVLGACDATIYILMSSLNV